MPMALGMSEAPHGPEVFRRRLVGLYALSLMEREGPLHGYRLSEAIAERTQGAWRPGPGAVYPSLQKLVEAHLATRKVAGRRRTYTITKAGSRLLASLRSKSPGFARARMDAAVLWAEIHGEKDASALLLGRLDHVLEALEGLLDSPDATPASRADLRVKVTHVLSRSLERFGAAQGPRPKGGRVHG